MGTTALVAWIVTALGGFFAKTRCGAARAGNLLEGGDNQAAGRKTRSTLAAGLAER